MIKEICLSADGLPDNLHCILESLDALRQTVDDFVLRVETLLHFILEAFSESHELSHGLPLKLFDIFVLFFKLTVSCVLKCTKLQRLVSALVINLLLQVILAVVHLLHDILLTFDSHLNLAIELVLKA